MSPRTTARLRRRTGLGGSRTSPPGTERAPRPTPARALIGRAGEHPALSPLHTAAAPAGNADPEFRWGGR